MTRPAERVLGDILQSLEDEVYARDIVPRSLGAGPPPVWAALRSVPNRIHQFALRLSRRFSRWASFAGEFWHGILFGEAWRSRHVRYSPVPLAPGSSSPYTVQMMDHNRRSLNERIEALRLKLAGETSEAGRQRLGHQLDQLEQKRREIIDELVRVIRQRLSLTDERLATGPSETTRTLLEAYAARLRRMLDDVAGGDAT